MKLTIEIDSKELKRAIETQVAAEVAKLTSVAIQGKIDEILPIKFSRVNENIIAEEIEKHARELVGRVYDKYSLKQLVDRAILHAAKEAIGVKP